MIEVKISNQEDFEKSVKLFKKLVNREEILQETRDRKYFMPKREKVRLKRERNLKRK